MNAKFFERGVHRTIASLIALLLLTLLSVGYPSSTPIVSAQQPSGCAPGQWNLKAPYPMSIVVPATAWQGGILYSFGAIGSDSYKYNPSSDSWTPIATLPAGRSEASAVSDGRYIYIFNGYDASYLDHTSMYRYDPSTDSYTTLPDAPLGTHLHAAVYLGGKIYRIAGGTTGAIGQTSVDVFNVSMGTWSPAGTVAPYPVATWQLAAIAYGGYIYTGGGSATETNKTYRYDPASNTWNDEAVTDLPSARTGDVSGILNGRWIVASRDGSVVALDMSNPTGSWTNLPSAPVALAGSGGGSSGQAFYIVGGLDRNNGPHAENQEYTEPPCTQPPPQPVLTPTPTFTSVPAAQPTVTPTFTSVPGAQQTFCGYLEVGIPGLTGQFSVCNSDTKYSIVHSAMPPNSGYYRISGAIIDRGANDPANGIAGTIFQYTRMEPITDCSVCVSAPQPQPQPPALQPTPTPTPTTNPTSLIPLIFVHGYYGFVTDASKCSAIADPDEYFGLVDNYDWAVAGYKVYYAHLSSSGDLTPPVAVNAQLLRRVITAASIETHHKAVIVSHSMGGIVARSYIESDDFTSDGEPVSELFTFGSPHNGGDPQWLAKIAELMLPRPCFQGSYRNKAEINVCNPEVNQLGACAIIYHMDDDFNLHHHLRTIDVKYHLIGGDAPAWARRFTLRGQFLKSFRPNDGLFSLNSSKGVGLISPIGKSVDRYETDEAHNTDLGLFDYFHDLYNRPSSKGYTECLKRVLIDKQENCGSGAGATIDSTQSNLLLTNPLSHAYTVDNMSFLATELSSQSPPAVALSTLASQGDAAQQLAQVPKEVGTLLSGQTATRSISMVGSGQAIFSADWEMGKVSVTLTDPNGQKVDPAFVANHLDNIAYDETGTSATYIFTNTLPGTWQVMLQAGDNVPAQGTGFITSAYFNSALTLTASTDTNTYAPGASATISTTLSGLPANAQVDVTAMILRVDSTKDTVRLSQQGEGRYQGVYTVAPVPGQTDVHVIAHGTTSDGTSFDREAIASFEIQSTAFSLGKSYNAKLEPCSTGNPNTFLLVTVNVKATEAGTVGLSADLVSADGNVVAHSYTSLEAVIGANKITLHFNGKDIQAAQRNGPYKVTNVLLSDLRGSMLRAATAQDALSTSAYKYTDFMCAGVGMPRAGVQDAQSIQSSNVWIAVLLLVGALILIAGGLLVRNRIIRTP